MRHFFSQKHVKREDFNGKNRGNREKSVKIEDFKEVFTCFWTENQAILLSHRVRWQEILKARLPQRLRYGSLLEWFYELALW